jgi:2-C-methyl-D-erythritol 4-phosphate cytidylyltransferase
MSLGVVLPAAGTSSRFGAQRSKLVQALCGKPVIAHTLAVFLARGDVRQVVIAAGDDSDVAQEQDPAWRELLRDPRVRRVAGGVTRAHSVLEALRAMDQNIEWVAIHDAARPLISHRLIDRTLDLAQQHGAAVPALPVALTIKRAIGPLPARVECTVPRQQLWAMQTPQIARRRDLLDAFACCPIPLNQVTDDVQLIELAGGQVWLTPGEERNLKITTQLDMVVARSLMEEAQ